MNDDTKEILWIVFATAFLFPFCLGTACLLVAKLAQFLMA